ncbi:MAG TPA: hypothetical protein VG603_08445 [Chitinophagales bacterium]|nr:hypothetical protein [Chitinophagales bacterium]
MSYIISPLVACEAVQLRLNDIYNSQPTEPTPLTSFLSSDINTSRILETSVSPGAGKLRNVKVVYTQRLTEDQVDSTLTTDCQTDNEPAQDFTTYELDPDSGVERKETFPLRDLVVTCQSNEDYVAQRIMAMLDAARRKMETELTSALAGAVGKFATNDTEGVATDRTYKTVATAYTDGRFNENALAEIVYSGRQAAFKGIPYIFGTGTIEKYFEKLYAPAVTQWGLDLEKYIDGKYVFLPSYRVANAFNPDANTERFVALDAGSFFILQYNKFEGMEGLNDINAQSSGLVQGVLNDPVTGIPFNYKWVYSPCGEYATAVVSTAFRLAALPLDMYASSDRLNGVNGGLVFEIANA